MRICPGGLTVTSGSNDFVTAFIKSKYNIPSIKRASCLYSRAFTHACDIVSSPLSVDYVIKSVSKLYENRDNRVCVRFVVKLCLLTNK